MICIKNRGASGRSLSGQLASDPTPSQDMKTFKITSRIDAVTGIPPKYLAAELPAPRAVKI